MRKSHLQQRALNVLSSIAPSLPGYVTTARRSPSGTYGSCAAWEHVPFTSARRPGRVSPNETMFLSQLPYVPLGDLRAVVTYPGKEGAIDDNTLKRTLLKVALPHLVDRLDEVLDWARCCSPVKQQRIAFARILLTRPKVVFLDESTSALDEGLEYMLYQLVRTELPDTILVSVSHRSHRRAASHPRTRAARRPANGDSAGGGRRGRPRIAPRAG